MLISNFNLCKSEWLELVFEKRNKEYGAYYIRQHYADTVVKAMLIAFATMITAIGVTGVLIRVKPATERMITVINDQVYQIPPAKKIEPPKPKIEQPKAAPQSTAPVNTTKFIPPVVVEDPKAEELPKIAELTGVIGQETIKGAGPGIAPIDAPGKGGEGLGDAMGNAADGKPYIAVENMPVPNGGSAGWAKFLQNTMRYPRQALDNEMSGRVIVSFIVEKDGHLSSIHVERGPGYGMDEEAARVLKLAKPWTPGMQNGNPVRVKLTLPVNFTFSE
jgi:protein TonB